LGQASKQAVSCSSQLVPPLVLHSTAIREHLRAHAHAGGQGGVPVPPLTFFNCFAFNFFIFICFKLLKNSRKRKIVFKANLLHENADGDKPGKG
jgi:hypothetical protein